ncbi:MAG: hypothetical protein ACI4LK_06550 [Lentihominibacter sp.]
MIRITPAMAGKALGVPAQAVRVGMQQGKLKIGTAFKQTGNQYTYVIYPEAIKEIIGEQEFKRMIEGA